MSPGEEVKISERRVVRASRVEGKAIGHIIRLLPIASVLGNPSGKFTMSHVRGVGQSIVIAGVDSDVTLRRGE